ncbi:MAG: DUF1634 domain-containing protein [Candidatus Methanoplasma sp.]|jgi:uncharacterized membrane protein|nr:DUF1634 domain-containing protein [Candidatus Methanoplasma sp.]
MNDIVSNVLRYCLFAGIAVLATGLILSEQEYGDWIMRAGVLILIASPFAGVLTAYVCLIAEKDWKWVKIATVLTALILVFLVVSLLRN